MEPARALLGERASEPAVLPRRYDGAHLHLRNNPTLTAEAWEKTAPHTALLLPRPERGPAQGLEPCRPHRPGRHGYPPRPSFPSRRSHPIHYRTPAKQYPPQRGRPRILSRERAPTFSTLLSEWRRQLARGLGPGNWRARRSGSTAQKAPARLRTNHEEVSLGRFLIRAVIFPCWTTACWRY